MKHKQVIAVRTDLKMSQGKTCAQVAHASLSSAEMAFEAKPEWYENWKLEGQKKVVVRVSGEKEIESLYEIALKKKVPCYIVKDAGLTELKPNTTTALGIGPAPHDIIDEITGELKLLK
ncbi:MAG: peptidyl-tRNA hydrolase Pth2 [Candidatus Hydrothermarchaeaceae archaeon]